MNTILIAIGLAIYTLLVLKRSSWGVYFVSLLLPTYLIRFSIFSMPLTFVEAIIWILFVVWLGKKIFRKELIQYIKKLPKVKFYYPALLFLTAATISVFVAADRMAALGIWKAYFLIPIVFYFIFVDVIKDLRQARRVVWALILSASTVSVIAIIQYFTGWNIPESYNIEGAIRATSIYSYPGAVGLFVAPILTLTIALLLSHRAELHSFLKSKLYFIVSTSVGLLMAGALLASRTEGAMIAFLGAVLFVLMFTKWKWKVLVIAVICLIVLFAIPQSRNYIWPLITFQGTSGDVRLAIWEGTIRLIRANPIFGAGLAGFPALYQQYKEAKHVELSLYPHNMLLNFWVELGLLGVIALIFLLYRFFKHIYKKLREVQKEDKVRYVVFMGVVACVLIYGLVDVPYFKNDLSILFWIWFGLASVDLNGIVKSKQGRIKKEECNGKRASC